MIPQTAIGTTDSIATICYDGKVWQTMLISSQKTSPLHSIVFKTKATAKHAAQKWAEINGVMYLNPGESFVSVVRALPRYGRRVTIIPTYSVAIVDLKGNISIAGLVYANFNQAVNAAAKSELTKKYPLVANYLIAKRYY